MALKQIYNKGKEHLDYRMGTTGAVVMGTWVFGTNLNEGGIISAGKSSAAQALYTFFVGGLVMKSCEKLAVGIKNKKIAIASSIIIPSLLTISAVYGIHKMIGTENPKTSTAPTTLAIPACAIWGTKKRNKLEKELEK